ncbi:alpha/beta hydrolase [Tersicoccus solisilvae]|nr:phospholipase [Tersicoccus solisilvae]
MTSTMPGAFSRPENERAGTHLLVMLHGYGTGEERMESLFATLPAGVTAAAPRGSLDVGGDVGWYLLDPGLRTDQGQVITAASGVLAWLDGVLATGPFASVSLFGFSQGMAMATMLLRLRPGRFRCVIGIGGFVPEVDLLAVTEPLPTRTPYLWQRGTGDRVIHPGALRYTQEWLEENTALTRREFDGVRHVITPAMMIETDLFLREHVLDAG